MAIYFHKITKSTVFILFPYLLHTFVSLLLIVHILTALTKQTNPNWKAYFFVTDEKPFDKELQQMLQKHSDARLVYLDVPVAHRPAVGNCFCFLQFNILL